MANLTGIEGIVEAVVNLNRIERIAEAVVNLTASLGKVSTLSYLCISRNSRGIIESY